MLCLIFMIHKENKGFMFIWTSWTSVTYREKWVFLQHGSSFVVLSSCPSLTTLTGFSADNLDTTATSSCNKFGVRELMLLCPNPWSLKPETRRCVIVWVGVMFCVHILLAICVEYFLVQHAGTIYHTYLKYFVAQYVSLCYITLVIVQCKRMSNWISVYILQLQCTEED